MKRLLCLVLVAALATLAGNLAGYVVPDRKPPGEYAPPKFCANNIGMKFVWIPPGTFMMGSPREEEDRRDNETPHMVTLNKGFYLSIHLVTQEQWQAVMEKNPSNFTGE